MGYEYIALQNSEDLFCYVFKPGSILHHFICDTCKSTDILWYGYARVYQCFIFFNDILSVEDLY